MAYRMGMNANNNTGARVPRNALRMWHAQSTVDGLDGDTLTSSLRWNAGIGAENAVHPKDWPLQHEPAHVFRTHPFGI